MINKTCTNCGCKYEYGKKCSCYNRNRKKNNAIKGNDDNFYTSVKWRKLRKQIIIRDGYCCLRCLNKSNKIVTKDIEVHHIIARSVDDTYEWEPTNLVTVCKRCNLHLGTSGVDWEHEIKQLREYPL